MPLCYNVGENTEYDHESHDSIGIIGLENKPMALTLKLHCILNAKFNTLQ